MIRYRCFCNIIADTAINPWILHNFQPKCVSGRFKVWSILTVVKAIFVQRFAPCNIAIALNVILYFRYAIIQSVTIYMKSVLERTNRYILYHPEKVCLKCIFMSYNIIINVNIWLIVVEVIFNRNVLLQLGLTLSDTRRLINVQHVLCSYF